MKRTLRPVAFATLLVAVLFTLANCRYTGGGWMSAAYGAAGKASFGFNMSCNIDTDEVKGELQYTDRPNGVKLHGEPDTIMVNLGNGWFPFDDCGPGPVIQGFVVFGGTYTKSGKSPGPSGRYMVSFNDSGEPGPSAGDGFCIMLEGGPYDGYENCNSLSGGNIQMLKEDF